MRDFSPRGWLLRNARNIYRNSLSRARIFRWLARQILRLGIVTRDELNSAQLGVAGPAPPKARLEASDDVPGFHFTQPLKFQTIGSLALKPYINVLLPSLRLKKLSGGPNTALLLAALLAEHGECVRLIGWDEPERGQAAGVLAHLDKLLGRAAPRERIQVVNAFDRGKAVAIGVNDIFLATAWWSAQVAKYALPQTSRKTFIYLIQDFEPILHDGSTFQALALETYSLPHIPVINTRLLRDHLVSQQVGLYADAAFAASALVFEPAIDRAFFAPEPAAPGGKKTLLFYARPNLARRNLFEIGVVALRQAAASGVINAREWDVWAMGEKIAPVALGNGLFLNPLPWMNFADYAKRIRGADLLLSLMLSPHPSYPPLEMAASGKLVVTNSFSVKTAAALQAISPNIIAAAPAAAPIAAALEMAAGRINAGLGSYDQTGIVDLPESWDASLLDVLPGLLRRIADLRAAPATTPADGLPAEPKNEYERYRRARLEMRRRDGPYRQAPGLLSFITAAYNTAPAFVQELAAAVFAQDGGTDFEWLILDNGSTDAGTREALRVISMHPAVRLARVEENLGIIGGMRFCLERATGRYILPLDSDDLIEPDCVHVLTKFITEQNYPALLYSDEDKLEDGRFSGPYFKPGWDPVLFLHSCYIAHLCGIDRELALQLGLYTAKTAEGCHDWDSFIRFMNAGFVPVHLPEVLYSWRMHRASTAGNITSKSFITASHRSTLQAALDHRNLPQLELVNSPLFKHNVDWRFRRKRDVPVSYLEISIPDAAYPVSQLATSIEASNSSLVHILWNGITPDDDEWRWDAAGLLEMFSDAAMVGGTLHDGRKVTAGPGVFGFGDGFGCPDEGRALGDPGYSAIMGKARSVSCVAGAHCVVRRDFLLKTLPVLTAENVGVSMLGPWLGALARQTGRRVLYSPFMQARARNGWDDSATPRARAQFLSRFWEQMPDTRFYSPHLGLTRATAYLPVSASDRARHMKALQAKTMPYADWLEARIRARSQQYFPGGNVSLAVLTTIYEKTSAVFLDALAESITGQSLAPAQWVIVAHGPIPEMILQHVQKSAAHWRATLVVETEPLGIMGAISLALANAAADYIVPVDADDTLTPDALQILASEIARLNRPDMVYSDEDLLVKGTPESPYLRAGFDKVLNLESSYIWHLCAIKRESALLCGLYTDAAATWCHDWDSAMRIAKAGGVIENIPEVLYHWRQHPASTTNQAAGDPRSLESVRHLLENHVAGLAYPERFAVEEWPESRGVKELYIARKIQDLPQLVWIGDFANVATVEEDAILLVTTNDVVVVVPGSFIEATRLLELHPHLGAVGGLVTGVNGIVVNACAAINANGVLESPWLGQNPNEGGLYALALKPQTVSATGAALAFFRIAALQECGEWPPHDQTPREQLALQLCAGLGDHGWGVAFSPLVRGRSSLAASAPITPPRGLAGGRSGLVRYGATRNFRL
jgi:glycosyltransferase involved in cell wall biosynthesis